MNPMFTVSVVKPLVRVGAVVIIVVFVLLYIQKKIGDILDDKRQRKFDEFSGSQVNEYVNKFYIVLDDWFEDEELLYKLAEELVTRKNFNTVSEAFRQKFGKTIEDRMIDEISYKVYERFMRILI